MLRVFQTYHPYLACFAPLRGNFMFLHQRCEGRRGAILGTMTTRPGTCRGGLSRRSPAKVEVFACWHSAWPSRFSASRMTTRKRAAGKTRLRHLYAQIAANFPSKKLVDLRVPRHGG